MDGFISLLDSATVSIVASIVSIASLVFSVFLNAKRMKLERTVQFLEHSRDIRSWGACVIQKMSEAVILCEMNPQKMGGEFYKRRQELRADISSLWDQGRMYFPNTNEDSIGQSKEGAYRGLRQKALDCVDEYYGFVYALDYETQGSNKNLQKCMVKIKREFVSELQKALKARQMETITKKLIKD